MPSLNPCVVIISIHSAARAETLTGGKRNGYDHYFNPLRREGGDRVLVGQLRQDVLISIHSAARAETLGWFPFLVQIFYFNPLRREGGDLQECIAG